jgi:hypothetical protein
VHQAITILQGLDPQGYPTVDGINPFETVLREFGNPPRNELHIRGGGIIINWFLGVEGFHCDVLERMKTKGLGGHSFVRHIEP